MEKQLFIGIMSGSSLDGVDAVLADFSSPMPQILARAFVPYSDDICAEILSLQNVGNDEWARARALGETLTKLYAQLANELAKDHRDQIRAIGVHGQTLRHEPQRAWSWQLNAPALLAELTNLDVVCDFRSRDLAAGGCGAPLVPRFHQALFSHETEARVLLNLGGIANISRLDPNLELIGFDTGPANILLDTWIFTNHGKRFDEAGAWAKSGKVLPSLLDKMLADPYFSQPVPKSTGRDHFNLGWILRQGAASFAPQDVQATLLAMTVESVARAIEEFAPKTQALFLCGGGAKNTALCEALAARLPHIRQQSTLELGFDAQDMEALAFAWLAWAFFARVPGNAPSVTGARGERVLGALYPA